MKQLSIDDLLNSLKNSNKPWREKGKLENTKETWERIGNRDKFEELGLERSELEEFLTEWIAENPYNNI